MTRSVPTTDHSYYLGLDQIYFIFYFLYYILIFAFYKEPVLLMMVKIKKT